jgi:hypothetical protein
MQSARARVSSSSTSSTSLNLSINRICEGGERLPSNGFSVPVSQAKGCLQSQGACSSNLCSNLLFELRQLRVHVARVQVEKEEAERERDAVLEQREEQREARRAQEETEEQVLLLQQEQEQAREREREREEQVLLLQHDAIAAMQAQEAKIICLTALEEEVSNSRVLIAHELRASYLELRACQQEMHSLKAKGAVGVGLLEMLAECTRTACKQVNALIADTKDLQERSLELELNERSLRVSVRHHSIPSVFD